MTERRFLFGRKKGVTEEELLAYDAEARQQAEQRRVAEKEEERKKQLESVTQAAETSRKFLEENGAELRDNPESIFAIRDLVELKNREERYSRLEHLGRGYSRISSQLIALQTHEISRNRIRNDSYRGASDSLEVLSSDLANTYAGRGAVINNLKFVQSFLEKPINRAREL